MLRTVPDFVHDMEDYEKCCLTGVRVSIMPQPTPLQYTINAPLVAAEDKRTY